MSTCPNDHDHELIERLLKMYREGDDPERIITVLGEERTRRLKQLREASRDAATYDRLVAKYGRQR